jgi:hypothetical protein
MRAKVIFQACAINHSATSPTGAILIAQVGDQSKPLRIPLVIAILFEQWLIRCLLGLITFNCCHEEEVGREN